jgi:alpha-ketoglutarate-dependent taurine dioxygenase
MGGIRDFAALTAWVADNRAALEKQLLAPGAILFRGFGFSSPDAFEEFARTISPKFVPYTGGATPRKHVKGEVYTSTEVPRMFQIPMHCEMSYLNRYPAKILFYCHREPSWGGQTPMVDMRLVYRDVDPAVRARFERRGVRLIRHWPSRRRLRVLKSWQEAYGTEDRAVVEDICRVQHTEFSWQPDGSLRTIIRRPAVITHPRTGEKAWFNSANVSHDSLSMEVRHLGRRLAAWGLERLEARRRRRLEPEQCRSHCTYGDESEISLADIRNVREVLWKHTVMFDWRQGDVLLLDNLAVGHGRTPYRGPRKVLAALIDPVTEDAAPGAEASAVSLASR